MPVSYVGIRAGRTFETWLEEVHRHLSEKLTEADVTKLLARQPLWDYWSSQYSPSDAADDMTPEE